MTVPDFPALGLTSPTERGKEARRQPAGEGRPSVSQSAASERQAWPLVPLLTAPGRDVDQHLVTLLDPSSFEADQYRTLRHLVERIRPAGQLKVLAVTSPGVGEGKTTTAINLAGAFSRKPGKGVLLIDADLRRPSIGWQIGLVNSSSPGLADLIMDSTRLPHGLFKPGFDVSVLPAGKSPTDPTAILQSGRVGELLAVARQIFDLVIVDLPPVLPVPDCRILEEWVDGLLLVVAANQTPRKLVEESLNVLDPGKLLGIVFNRDDRPLSGYYRYYRAYGYPSRRAGRHA
jgi:protein-tyrosine kinase